MIKNDADLFQQAIMDLEKENFNDLCTNFYSEIEKRNYFFEKTGQMESFQHLYFTVIYFKNEYFLLKSFDLNFLNNSKIILKGDNDDSTFTIKVKMEFENINNYQQFVNSFKKSISSKILELKSKFILALNDSDDKLNSFLKYNVSRQRISLDVLSFSDFKRLNFSLKNVTYELLIKYFKDLPREYIQFVSDSARYDARYLSWKIGHIRVSDPKELQTVFETAVKKLENFQELNYAMQILDIFNTENDFIDANYLINISNKFDLKNYNEDCHLFISKSIKYLVFTNKYDELYDFITFLKENQLINGNLDIEMLKGMPKNIAHKIFDSYFEWSLDLQDIPANNKSIEFLILLYKEFDLLNNSKIKISSKPFKSNFKIKSYELYLADKITEQNYKSEYKNMMSKMDIISNIYNKFF